jgi:hypothetical protein
MAFAARLAWRGEEVNSRSGVRDIELFRVQSGIS